MSKEKLASLTKYSESLKSKISDSSVPNKHQNRQAAYKNLLSRELKKVMVSIDKLTLDNTKAK